jgi:hypothetical protein
MPDPAWLDLSFTRSDQYKKEEVSSVLETSLNLITYLLTAGELHFRAIDICQCFL